VSLRSPLGRVIGLGSAKSGSAHWFSQRLTAVAVTLLGLWFLVALISLGSLGYDDLSGWLAHPTNAVLSALLVIASAQHAWLGLQVVIEDYVGGRFARLALIVATKAVLILAATAGVLAILRIAVGAGE
jgi:succinate dehydrogenase / fumarate reductase membrane anchor subunit